MFNLPIKIGKIKRLFSALILLVFFLEGCVNDLDLEKVQKFGEVSKEFEKKYPDIVKDLYASCMRTARYTIPLNERGTQETSCIDNFDYQRQDALLKCHEFLANYTSALRTLASDEILELESLNKLGDEIASIPTTVFPEVKVFAKIAENIIAELIRVQIENYRNTVIKESIEKVNIDIQIFIANLGSVTEQIYQDRLNLEATAINKYYQSVLTENLDIKNPNEITLDEKLLRLNSLQTDRLYQQDVEKAEINKKLAELYSYMRTLKEMANLHQELYNSLKIVSN